MAQEREGEEGEEAGEEVRHKSATGPRRTENMKIIVVVPALGQGGVERVVSLLTTEWAKRHRVLIVRFDGSRPPAWPFGGETLDLRLPPARHPARKLLNAGLRALRLAALFRRARPARIIAFTESANFAAIVAATVTGQLDRLQISTRVDPATKPPAHRALMPLLYRLPARIVAVSAGVKQGLEAMHIPSKRITVIYNPKASGGG